MVYLLRETHRTQILSKFIHSFAHAHLYSIKQTINLFNIFHHSCFYGILYKINIFTGAYVYLHVRRFDVYDFVLTLIFIGVQHTKNLENI